MAKIGIDIRNIGKKRTGDEVVFFNYVKNLALIDNENEYYLFTDIADTPVYQYMGVKLGIENKNNFKIISLQSSNKFVWNLWTLPRYLRKNPVDVYHTQYITPFFVSHRVKIVTTIHDISFNFYPQFIKFSDLFFLKILIPMSFRRADKIITVSEFTKNEIIKYYKVAPEKIEVAYNSIGDTFISLTPALSLRERGQVLEKYDLPDKFILYLGTMQPRKNLPMLIEAFINIKDKIPEIKLVLAGNKTAQNFDKKIDETIKKYNLTNDVIFTGYIDEEDKPLIFRLARLFVFPSLYEGFGIPILEAMSQSIPAVISDIPVHKEIAEGAAIYFNPQNLANLEEKLYNAIIDENLRKKLIDLGLRRVQFFSWEKTAQNLLKIYKSLNN
jgi:glycosyltransferase involved in cell wall biosynthesis